MVYPERALIVGFDGVTPGLLQGAQTPNVDPLVENGVYSWHAECTLPTWTLQCFVSHLAGVEANEYEIVNLGIGKQTSWLEPRRFLCLRYLSWPMRQA